MPIDHGGKKNHKIHLLIMGEKLWIPSICCRKKIKIRRSVLGFINRLQENIANFQSDAGKKLCTAMLELVMLRTLDDCGSFELIYFIIKIRNYWHGKSEWFWHVYKNTVSESGLRTLTLKGVWFKLLRKKILNLTSYFHILATCTLMIPLLLYHYSMQMNF